MAISPHYYNTRRNLENFGLTLLPDSKIRFRLGYNHNTNSGPSFNTIHQGTEQFLFQNISTGMNQYRLGVDFRFLPRTNISYDQSGAITKPIPARLTPTSNSRSAPASRPWTWAFPLMPHPAVPPF